VAQRRVAELARERPVGESGEVRGQRGPRAARGVVRGAAPGVHALHHQAARRIDLALSHALGPLREHSPVIRARRAPVHGDRAGHRGHVGGIRLARIRLDEPRRRREQAPLVGGDERVVLRGHVARERRVEQPRHAQGQRGVGQVRVPVRAAEGGHRVLAAPRAGAEVAHLAAEALHRRARDLGRQPRALLGVRERDLCQPQGRHLVRDQGPLPGEAIAGRRGAGGVVALLERDGLVGERPLHREVAVEPRARAQARPPRGDQPRGEQRAREDEQARRPAAHGASATYGVALSTSG
jgi:hypothetical protein